MLHLNELPLRHIMNCLDGPTSGPTSFSGNIGKELFGYFRSLPVVNYHPIQGNIMGIPLDIISQLSSDQLYLYHIGLAIQRGREYLDLSGIATKSPGKIHYARWLTTAN